MKRLCILIFLLLPILCFNSVNADNINLLKNSGFDDSDSGFFFWTENVWDNTEEAGKISLSQQSPYSGKNCLKIECNKPNDARLVQTIPVQPSTIYKISGWIKTQNVGEEAKGANLSVWMLGISSEDIRGNSDWTYVEFFGKTSDEQKSLEFTIGLGGHSNLNTGTAYFDDISISIVEDIPPGAEISSLYNSKPEPEEVYNSAGKQYLPLIALAFAVIIVSLGILMLFKRKENLESTSKIIDSKHLDKKDYIIMSAMTFIYLFIALFQLGTTNVPETYWTTTQSGESFTINFNAEKTVDKLAIYSGIDDVSFVVQYPNENGQYLPIATFDQGTEEALRWHSVDIGKKVTELKFTLGRTGGTLSEIVILEKGSGKPITDFTINKDELNEDDQKNINNLFDEFDVGDYKYNFMNSAYFDEIYHPRTAFENLHGLTPYETTHPPLGKLIISLGVAIFGMNPFGWRIMGTLFGVAMVPVMYLFGRKLFKGRIYGFIGAFLMMFDLMHFAQTRIGTIDAYPTLFVMLAYFFMADNFLNKPYKHGFRRSLLPLLLSGVFWGLACASKWTAVYAGGGLALLYLISRVNEYIDYKKALKNTPPEETPPAWTRGFVRKSWAYTSLCCVVFFVVIPLLIYIMSYLPIITLPGEGHGVGEIWENQKYMYNYHSNLTATHSFQSPAYSWPLISKPLLEYRDTSLPQGQVSIIYVLGNPAIYWFGIFAILAALPIGIFKKDKRILLILTAFAFQYLPWFLVSRCIFIYHFFTAVPFLMLCIVYFIKWWMEDAPELTGQLVQDGRLISNLAVFTKALTLAYLILVFAAFIVFYPAVSGMVVDDSYINLVRWLNVY